MPSYLITCPSCNTENRVPAGKEGMSGRCGTCHARLPALHIQPVVLTEHTFDNFVRNFDAPILAEFWAPW